MAFVDQFNKGMQRVMAMRTPEIMALLPRVEAMEFDERVEMVKRGRANLSAVLKEWRKFEPILVAQGHDRKAVKKRLKALKSAKNHLDDALRLADPKLPPAFKPQAESAFNVLAACFLRDAGMLDAILTGPRIGRDEVGSIDLPEGLPQDGSAHPVDDLPDAGIVEAADPMAGLPDTSRGVAGEESLDLAKEAEGV